MSDPILISDGEDEATPPPSKRARKNPTPTVLNLDSYTSPDKRPPGSASNTPLVVVDEPHDVTVVKSSTLGSGIGVSSNRESLKFSGRFPVPESSKRVISLESDSEDNSEPLTAKKYVPVHADDSWKQRCGLESGSIDADSDDDTSWMQSAGFRSTLSKDAIEVDSDHEKEDTSDERMGRQKQAESYKSTSLSVDALPKKKMSKDEKTRATEEKKLRKEQEKLQKAAMKAEDAEHKKLQKEKKKWEKDKALESIVALIDNKLIEASFGGRLVSGLQENDITYRIVSNPIERSIVWEITLPEDIAQTLPLGSKIPYVLLVYEAEDFCNLVANKELPEKVSRVREEYPSYTICYLTHKLMSYVNKKERIEYKDPVNCSGWSKPPIDEAIAKLTTHYIGVHSRHCVDEAEVAEHVVRLTSNLAYCQVRDKLTRLSVCAASTCMSQKGADKHLIRDNLWLKVLVAIPKVPPRHAVAVSKKYPSLKSLLEVYMNPNMSVHEKEFILKDLKVENLVGEDRRVGEACSKRIYRVLMCKDGTIKTDDVVDGAASFTLLPYDLD